MNALRATVGAFGVVAGLAGVEHGVGEVLQGNAAPEGMRILSWPDSKLFEILAGEPALTIVPNLFVSGILAILSSLAFLLWTTAYVGRYGGHVTILLSIVMLLVGAGLGPPMLGIILGVAAIGMNGPLSWWRAHLSGGSRRFLARVWPWSLTAGVIAWLLVLPGTVLLDLFFGVNNPNLVVPALTLSAFGLLLLTIFTGFVYDAQRQIGLHPTPWRADDAKRTAERDRGQA